MRGPCSNSALPGDFVLHLRPLPADVPAHIRMRRLLKTLLRGYRFRCVRAREVGATLRNRA